MKDISYKEMSTADLQSFLKHLYEQHKIVLKSHELTHAGVPQIYTDQIVLVLKELRRRKTEDPFV